jgi:hypothetical protein
MKYQKLTLKAGAGSTKISLENAIKFLGADAIEAGEKRGTSKHYGPYSIITSYTALATTATWKDIGLTYGVVNEYTLHGNRTITNPKQSGYGLEGYVSIDGIKRSCFTSSILFEIEETKQLIDVAVIHVRTKKD